MFLTFDIHENEESQEPLDELQRHLRSFHQTVEIAEKGFNVQFNIIL
jgi:hypothetical protein